jgi:SAM-dependent methyltransferase
MGYKKTDFTGLDEINIAQRRALEKALEMIPSNGRVLEVGVGSGEVSNLLAARGIEVYSMDNSKECLERITNHSRVYVCDLNSPPLPFAEGFFDLAIMYEVIEHLWNPIGALQDLRRLLKQDGRLLISTPNVSWAPYRIMYLFGFCPDDFHSTNHLQFWNWKHFEAALNNGGFSMERTFSDVAIPVLLSDRSGLVPFLKWFGLDPRHYYGRCFHYIRFSKRRVFGWDMVAIAKVVRDNIERCGLETD